jgi:hypothetical protein
MISDGEREGSMPIGKHSDAQIIDALKQMEAGRTASELGRELGVSKHTIFFRNPTFISCWIWSWARIRL